LILKLLVFCTAIIYLSRYVGFNISPKHGFGRWDIAYPWCHPMAQELTKTFEFKELKTFTLRSLFKQPWNRFTSFEKSSIWILPSENQKADIVVEVSFNSTNLALGNHLEFQKDESSGSLTIIFPKETLPPTLRQECIETETIIYVRPGLFLDHFELESTFHSVHIPSELDFTVNTTNISIHSGFLVAKPMFQSRETYIRDHSGRVSGTYPVYDVLDIETHSGIVAIDVLPKEADPKEKRAAVLSTKTHSGRIEIQYPPNGIEAPPRQYKVHVQSESGSIQGRFIHGEATHIRTRSGSLHADLIAYAAYNYPSELTTETASGRQDIKVILPYVSHDKPPLQRLDANHISESGSLDVRYPPSWEGTVKVVSRSGRVSVAGEGLRIINEGRSGSEKFIEAKRGDGDSTTLCRTRSGSVSFSV
jgi:hypothetical protein